MCLIDLHPPILSSGEDGLDSLTVHPEIANQGSVAPKDYQFDRHSSPQLRQLEKMSHSKYGLMSVLAVSACTVYCVLVKDDDANLAHGSLCNTEVLWRAQAS